MDKPLTCVFCGELERCRIFEVYSSGEFQLETCCEGMDEEANRFLAEDPKAAAAWLETLGHDDDDEPILPALGLERLRRVIDAEGQLLLDWNLKVRPIAWKDAKAFVAKHHRHCPAPAGWRFGAAVWNGSQLLGVVIVGRPVARMIDQKATVEVNRLCIRDDLARDLGWNACSLLYGWAAREAKKRGFSKILTYTLATEAGTTLRAAGWAVDGKTVGRTWNCSSRPRAETAPRIDKVRWARQLRQPVARPFVTCGAIPA